MQRLTCSPNGKVGAAFLTNWAAQQIANGDGDPNVAWLAKAPIRSLGRQVQAVREGRGRNRDNCGLNRHEHIIEEICDSAASVKKIRALVADGYNYARDIKAEFEKRNPTQPKFGIKSWCKILADDRLDLACWGTAVPRGSPCWLQRIEMGTVNRARESKAKF